MGVAFSVLKNETPYKDPKVNYEELMVKKNAPRWIRTLKLYGLPVVGPDNFVLSKKFPIGRVAEVCLHTRCIFMVTIHE